MVFSSLEFIFGFLPIFLIVYLLIPKKSGAWMECSNLVLLIGSLFFYAVGEPVYVLLMVASILLNYLMARGIEYYAGKKAYLGWRKSLLLIAVLFNGILLFVFKYADFVSLNINRLISYINANLNIGIAFLPHLGLDMPIGISFYTFQILSYVIDVYYQKYPAEKNIISLGTYIAMFPQLIAGPIVKYEEVSKRLRKRKITPIAIDYGLKIFIFGLGAKVLIANRIGILWTDIERIGFESISTPLAWMGAFAYSFQIYFDFFGYSLMAIGLGKMLGFSLPENFKDPYCSRSVTEFWQRWHITLGRWLRDYIYIPLGGNRCSRIYWLRNVAVVWLFTGIWHGADWNFLIWGAGFGILVMIEKLFLKKILDRYRIVSALYMLLIIPISWIVFAISDLNRLVVYLSRMFPFIQMEYESNINSRDFIRYGKLYGILFVIAGICCIPRVRKQLHYIQKKKLGAVVAFLIFILATYFLSQGLDNPFLYYRF
ncbi:MAG TPA: MBOAT family O-acyltransferase [Lachnospiraceae bacterium]|nr:MBOAT family O-acyltransferase [Lachnospiraceae bacterium]